LSENEVEIGDLKQLGLALLYPGKCLIALALRAMAIATTAVGGKRAKNLFISSGLWIWGSLVRSQEAVPSSAARGGRQVATEARQIDPDAIGLLPTAIAPVARRNGSAGRFS
jgi:hypothetical protein